MRFIFCCVLLLFSTTAHVKNHKNSIQLAAYSYPPFSGELLTNGGVWLDLVSQAFAKVDFHVEYTFFPFARVFSESQFGQQQGVVCLWYSQIRSESYFLALLIFIMK